MYQGMHMKIKELEEKLGTPRANIRYYEKEGLFSPERKENGYREYTEQDEKQLKTIVILRKLGTPVPQIRALLNGQAQLSEVLSENLLSLQKQKEELESAIRMCEDMERQGQEMQDFPVEDYWEKIHAEERGGGRFLDICKDYLEFEADLFGSVWEFAYFFDISDERKKHGLLGAVGIVLLLCVLRGLSWKFLWKSGSFFEGFFEPIAVFLIVSLFMLPAFLFKKHPKALNIYMGILAAICVIALAIVVLGLLVILANTIFHFWF